MKKTIRRIITFVVVAALICGAGYEGLLYAKKRNQKTVTVVPVSQLNQEVYDYGDSDSTLDGNIASNVKQKISVNEDSYVEAVYVEVGQHVKKGDLLMSYDMTLQEMEQNINRLSLQEKENSLKKSEKRLESLKNGGPIETEDLSGGMPSIGDTGLSTMDDMGMDDDMAKADFSMNSDDSMLFGAALNIPLFATVFADDEIIEMSETLFSEDAGEMTENPTDSFGDEIEDMPIVEGPDDPNEDIGFSDPFEDFSPDEIFDGESNGGSSDNDSLFSDDSAVDDPVTEVPTSSLLHKTLSYDTLAYRGNGTEFSPLVFLCDATDEKVYADASFLNRMAGYSADGLTLENPGGFWFRLEFYYPSSFWDEQETDSLAAFTGPDNDLSFEELDEALHELGHSAITSDDFSENAVLQGFYQINGGKYAKKAPFRSGHYYTLNKATLPDDPNGEEGYFDEVGDIVDGGEYSAVNREDAIRKQEIRVESEKLSIRKLKLNISKMDKKLQNKNVYSAVDGTVISVGDINAVNASADSFGSEFLIVESDRGCYVEGTISEMSLDDIEIGTVLSVYSYDSGQQFDATVSFVSDYPSDGGSSDFMGSYGNQNASRYSFIADMDEGLQMESQSWVTISYKKQKKSQLNLLKAFARTENGQTYVYKAVDGKLHKQYITVGASKDSGWSVPVISGVSMSDCLAFPYGADVKEGASVQEGTLDDLNSMNLML